MALFRLGAFKKPINSALSKSSNIYFNKELIITNFGNLVELGVLQQAQELYPVDCHNYIRFCDSTEYKACYS